MSGWRVVVVKLCVFQNSLLGLAEKARRTQLKTHIELTKHNPTLINTAAVEFSPAFSRAGHWLFFHRDRPGGFGGLDIWASYREHVHDDFDWQPPINLSSGVNSPYDDAGPTFFQDDDTGTITLYFTSNRPGVAGAADIFSAVMNPDGSFGPSALVPELNSPGRDTRTAIRHDGLEIIFQSDRTGGMGSGDLWVSTRATTLDAWSTPVNAGPSVNTIYFDGAPAHSADGETLLFYSNRPGRAIPRAWPGVIMIMTGASTCSSRTPNGGLRREYTETNGNVNRFFRLRRP